MGKFVEQSNVLIVSDNPDRCEFLHYHIKCHYLSPIWYPNILSARKAVRSMPFSMVVVDLSLPIESKLTLYKRGMSLSTGCTGNYYRKDRIS